MKRTAHYAQWRRHARGGAPPVGGLRDVREAARRGIGGLGEHDARAPAGMGGEDPVVQQKIDARARDQGGELLEELQGLEEQVAGAVGPGGLQRQPDAAVAGEPESVLGHRGPEEVAAELLEWAAELSRIKKRVWRP